jgi:hypothetical protein
MRFPVIAGALVTAGVLLAVGMNAERQMPRPIAGVSTDPSISAILGRACQDCHSEQTAWPWYTHIPPVGAAIRKDVNAARAQMNFSHWAQYQPSQKEDVLGEMAALVRNRQMPPARYTLLHPAARLSTNDMRRLIEWTLVERRRIRAAR